jgi:hypothetical protein
MDNPKTLATLGIQDTGNIGHTRHWQHWAHKTLATLGIQDTGNIGHTRHWQHWAYNIQDKDKESKTKNTTQKTKMMSSTDPTQKN